MKNKALALSTTLLAASILATSSFAADTWTIDPVHSNVGFTVRHFVSKTSGRFGDYKGTITLDPKDLKKTAVNVEIQAKSVNTDNEKRDAHLNTADFFDTANHPTITFVSTEAKPKTDTTGILLGNLTIRGVTKPVELAYEILGFGPDAWGNERAGFQANGTINRKDFGVNWNTALDNGGFVLGDDVVLNITVEAVKEKPEAAAKS